VDRIVVMGGVLAADGFFQIMVFPLQRVQMCVIIHGPVLPLFLLFLYFTTYRVDKGLII
jgi:hypothetical protein